MSCGCKERMEKLEKAHPKVADVVRPAHKVAMKVVDRIVLRAGGKNKKG